MKLARCFFGTTFNPHENFEEFKEDLERDLLGFKLFSLSLGIQIALPIIVFLVSIPYLEGRMTAPMISILLTVVIFNLLLLTITHLSLFQFSDKKQSDWRLVMGLIGMSSLPMIVMSLLKGMIPIGGILFYYLGAILTGVIIGVGAHVLFGARKDVAMILAPILLIAVGYLTSPLIGLIFGMLK
jgi:hypothetical protein